MINKPFFGPGQRRTAQVGQNLPPPSPNFMNLPAGFDVGALAAALAACGPACAPGGVMGANGIGGAIQAAQP